MKHESNKRRKLIYIVGCSHCGSTLLTRVLARHSQIATVGELKMSAIPDYRNYQCGCGADLLKCPFWQDVASACAKKGVSLDFSDFGTHYRTGKSISGRIVGASVKGGGLEILRKMACSCWLPAARMVGQINSRNNLLIETICEVKGKPVFLDDSKDPTRLLHLSRMGGYDIRAIHLIRDGRAIIASHKKRNPDMSSNIDAWLRKTRECERLRRVLPHLQMLEVRYEEFCHDPRKVLSEIFGFSGIGDESEHCLSLVTHEAQHIIGHHSRLEKNEAIVLRNDWPVILNQCDLKRFERRGSRLNALYGYEMDRFAKASGA